MNNKTLGIVIAAIVIIAGIAYFATRTQTYKDNDSDTYPPSGQNTNTQNTNTQTPSSSAPQGRVVFSVKDAAADMGAVSDVTMQVSKVEVHGKGDTWTTVSTTPRTFNLLTLNAQNKSEVLADAKIAAVTYDQILLTVDSVTVKMKSGETKTAKLPSGKLQINTLLLVAKDKTASVNFDFLASKSLHMTGNGQYIFAPVVTTDSRSDAKVTVGSDKGVVYKDGHVDYANSVGMDIDGSIKVNFQINDKQKLIIDANNAIKADGVLK